MPIPVSYVAMTVSEPLSILLPAPLQVPSPWCLVGSVVAFVGCLVFAVFERRDRFKHRALTSVPSVNFFLRENWSSNNPDPAAAVVAASVPSDVSSVDTTSPAIRTFTLR